MTPFDPVTPGTPEQSGLAFQSTASGFKPEFEIPADQQKLYNGKILFSAEGLFLFFLSFVCNILNWEL